MKVLFITNIASPYRVDFFNELGKSCDLTVAFERKRAEWRNEKWESHDFAHFKGHYMKSISLKGGQIFCPEVTKIIHQGYDHIILGGYSSPTAMWAIEYMRLHRIPFWLEADGGMVSDDSALKYRIKKHFISSASGWFSSGKTTTEYLVHYGADETKVHLYPFTSLRAADILPSVPTEEEKMKIRQKLGIGGGGVM